MPHAARPTVTLHDVAAAALRYPADASARAMRRAGAAPAQAQPDDGYIVWEWCYVWDYGFFGKCGRYL